MAARLVTLGIRRAFGPRRPAKRPAEIVVVELTGLEAQVFAHYIGREIVPVFRDPQSDRSQVWRDIKLRAPPERVPL